MAELGDLGLLQGNPLLGGGGPDVEADYAAALRTLQTPMRPGAGLADPGDISGPLAPVSAGLLGGPNTAASSTAASSANGVARGATSTPGWTDWLTRPASSASATLDSIKPYAQRAVLGLLAFVLIVGALYLFAQRTQSTVAA